MIKPKKLLSSLTFVIITSKVKSSLLLHYIGKFKLNLMLGFKGKRGWGVQGAITITQQPVI